jgi:hypothetical protein
MEDRNKLLLELYQIESSSDNMEKLKSLSSINHCLFELVQNLFEKGVEIKYHQREFEGKYFRFGLSNQSIINLINGNSFDFFNKKVSMIDIDSLYSVTRMQIETFLILFYLVFDEISDEEKDFRYDIYKLHGVLKQSEFKIENPSPERTEDIKSIENEILELKQKIKLSSMYISASLEQRKEYLKPKYAKLIKSEIVFSKSGIKKSRIDEMWKIYSNYAHAEHISDRQFNYRRNNQKATNETASLIITMNKILTSKLILFLKQTFKENEEKYLEFSLKDRVCIEMFMGI